MPNLARQHRSEVRALAFKRSAGLSVYRFQAGMTARTRPIVLGPVAGILYAAGPDKCLDEVPRTVGGYRR
jgi:hypothetical protein